ncbi:MAG TPA: hypothetical protein VF376_07495 [Thermoanaerobaculia bacterium]
MFVGHFGLGFAGKRLAPAVSLGTLFLAVEFADGLWPILLLAGVEHVRIVPGLMKTNALDLYDYPWSHSLAALVVWGAILAAAYFAATRSRPGSWVVAAGVVSHWFLDVAMHRPDVPVLPRGPFVGLSLWNSLPATLLVEGGLYLWGIGLYLRATRARDRTGTISLWTLVLVVFALWLAALFGPPPPDVRALAVGGLFGWLLIAWGYWVDRHREPRNARRA